MLPTIYRKNDDIGIRLDVLIDARIEVDSAKHHLQEMYVILDHIVDDDNGIWTEDEVSELRMAQRMMSALMDSKNEDLKDIRLEEAEVREEMGL